MFMNTYGERVRARRTELGMSQADLAKAIGAKHASTIGNIENRPGESRFTMELAEALGVTINWLRFGSEPKLSAQSGAVSTGTRPLRNIAVWENEEELGDDYIFLPALQMKLSASDGVTAWHVEEKGQKQAFTRKWADRHCIDPACAATMVVSGNSMEPRLLDGDSVVIDYSRNSPIIDGKIYAILLNGEVYIKRLFKEVDGSVKVVSDNPDKTRHPDKFVPSEHMDRLKIIGMAIAVSGGL